MRPQNTSYKSLLVTKIISFFKSQCAMKFVSNNLPLVDCAIGLVNSLLNLPAGQVKFFGEFKLQKNCIQSCSSNIFFKAVKETLRLVRARYSLPKWQAVKLTFFTPWVPLQIGGKSLIIQKWIKSPIKKLYRVIVSRPLVLTLTQGWLYTARLTFWKANMCEKDLTYDNVHM